MWRDRADAVNLASRAAAGIERQFPGERVLFASAATILETRQEAPAGWTLQRVFQRRGTVTITDARVVVQSSFLSPITLLFALVLGNCLFRWVQVQNAFDAILALGCAAILLQRLPMFKDVPFKWIKRVHFGTVRGFTGSCDIVSIVTDWGALQVVPAQLIPEDVRELLTALNRDRSPDASDPH